MKRVVVIVGVLVLAAAAVGAVVFTMNSGSSSAASTASGGDGHDHGHDHAGHTHGPNGECPLDAATAVGVEEPASKDGMGKGEMVPTPVAAPVKPGA